MSIELDPTELGFERPFNHEVIQTLHIRNPNYDPVAFKVKTTAPKQYCVRPNSGRIEVGKQVEVQVLLQAMKEDPPADYKCRDKFLVQSVAITADKEYSNVGQIWSHVERNEKSAIQEKKIRVVFLQPGELSAPNGDAPSSPIFTQGFEPHQSPPPYSDPAPTQHEGPSTVQSVEPIPIPKPESKVEYDMPVQNRTAGSPDVSFKLAEAQATIAKLQEQLKEQTLREKASAAIASESKERIAEGTAGLSLATHPPEGISVQACAAMCLAAFLLAYFFF
ncbi:VAMP-associated protein [Choiromyces venosus 120613-1]|uniref:VAMP-associated protein n=1 Tax=Choiromyces venosus 120613-1 TaxID=1336337 RepID=A0A3N4IZ61_9PEZI|nr:VAMP-associated protein [Choiromyces venosus 120613-1]